MVTEENCQQVDDVMVYIYFEYFSKGILKVLLTIKKSFLFIASI